MIYVPKVAHTNFSLAYPLNLFSPEKSLGHVPTASIYLVLSWAGFSSWYHLYLSSLSLWEGAFSSVTHVWSTSILSIIIEGVCGLKTVVCYPFATRGVLWSSTRSVPLWVPVECLPGDGRFRFPSCGQSIAISLY